jgi:hypothetical protein
MVTVGYGDVTPQTTLEIIFVVLGMMISVCIFAYALNRIGEIIRDISKEKEEFKQEMQIVNKFLKQKKYISNDLKTEIK